MSGTGEVSVEKVGIESKKTKLGNYSIESRQIDSKDDRNQLNNNKDTLIMHRLIGSEV